MCKLSCDLRPGVYTLGLTGGDGKSYLCKYLRTSNIAGNKNVIGLSYGDYVLYGIDGIIKILEPFYDIVMLDKLNLYLCDELLKYIESRREKTVILLDYKIKQVESPISYLNPDSAVVVLSDNVFEVK